MATSSESRIPRKNLTTRMIFFALHLLTPLFPRRRVPGQELPYYANVLGETTWTWL